MYPDSRPHRAWTPTWASIAAVILLWAAPTWADLIILKNGNEIRGKILSQGPNRIVIEVPYGKMVISPKQVREIQAEEQEDYLRKTGQRLLGTRDLETALSFLRQAWQQNPESSACRQALIDGLLRCAADQIDRRRFRKSAPFLEEAADLDPENAELRQLRQRVRRSLEDRKKLELEAEQAVSTQDLSGAHAAFTALMERFPEDRDRWREGLARFSLALGHLEFEEKRHERARKLYHQALTHDPDLIAHATEPLAFIEIQRVVPLLEQGQFAQARAQLRQAQALLPDNPAIIYHLALAAEGAGEASEAAHLYAAIAGEDGMTIDARKHIVELRRKAEEKLQNRSGRAPQDRRWKQVEEKVAVHRGRQFEIHHHNAAQAKEVERYLLHHWNRLQADWFRQGQRPKLRNKVAIHLHPTRAAYREAIQPPEWSDGVTRNEQRYGLLVSQAIHFDASAPQFLASVLPHELCHVLLPHWMGPGVDIPLWIDEGIATSEEPEYKQRYYERVAIEALIDESLFPLPELFAMKTYPDTSRVGLYYSQANSLVRFLRERLGKTKAFELFRKISTQPWSQALEQAPFKNLGQLERAWIIWLRKRA